MPDDVITAKPLVCVVVLNYNGRDHLGYCLPSLAATDYSHYEIIVVDNASPDGSADMVAALCPGARLIRSKSNRGWSGCERGTPAGRRRSPRLVRPPVKIEACGRATACSLLGG